MGNTTNFVNLVGIENRLDELRSITKALDSNIRGVSQDLQKTNMELEQLRTEFIEMMQEQRNQATLQQASTELVRVRQELERDYGNYKVIRETMLGVLQATDLALVKKATISRVSEELMLSTPKYWLAPCLIAVSAWIANDRELADRAIRESMNRDPEKTAITMALICRRNNRIQTCYEWLSIYFSYQNSAQFSESSFAYIDAYINGVFGPDENHMCDDYIVKWMNEIKGNSSNLESEQAEIWSRYCKNFSVDIQSLYPELSTNVREYPRINAYISRILATDPIIANFDGINNAEVSKETLKSKIDNSLIRLISRYNDDEEPLRKEEEYLKAIKFFNGDKEMARQTIVAAEKKRQENTYTLVDRMTHVITTKEDVSPSERKTAVSFLSGYIRKGYNQYIKETKNNFPEKVTIQVDDWSGTSDDGTNTEELCQDYLRFISVKHSADVVKAQKNNSKIFQIAAIVVAVFALVSCFLAGIGAGVFFLLVAGGLFLYSFKCKRNSEKKIELLDQQYMEKERKGIETIKLTAKQWSDAKKVVYDFETGKPKEIVA